MNREIIAKWKAHALYVKGSWLQGKDADELVEICDLAFHAIDQPSEPAPGWVSVRRSAIQAAIDLLEPTIDARTYMTAAALRSHFKELLAAAPRAGGKFSMGKIFRTALLDLEPHLISRHGISTKHGVKR